MSLFKLENTSNISDDKLEAFINAPWEEDLKSIPGVGPKAEELFKEAEVEVRNKLTFLCIISFISLIYYGISSADPLSTAREIPHLEKKGNEDPGAL